MELFSLVAKLTLDTKEYDSAIKDAVSDGKNIQDVTAELNLDTSQFDSAIREAENADVENPESPELDLDDNEFWIKVDEAEDAEVDSPEEPDLDLDTDPFDTAVEEAESVEVDDPEAPSLSLDTSDYSNAVEEVTSQTGSLETSMGSAFDNISGLLTKAGIAGAIIAVGNAIGDAIDQARQLGDNIDKSSRAMSVSTDFYQEWSHVLGINGASITDLNRGLMNMRKLMGGGDASAEFAEAMDELGLSAKVASGEISSTEDLLTATMKALADYGGDGARRDYLAQAIFGRGGTKLNAMFDGTSEDIDYLIDQAHELGYVMTEEEIANAASYNDAVTNLQSAITGLKTAFVADIIPFLTEAANGLTNIVSLFNPRTKSVSLVKQFEEIDTQLASSLVNITGTASAAEDMIDKLFDMGEASSLSAEQQAEWKGVAEWLVRNIPELSNVINLDTMEITANKDEVIALTKAWKENAIQQAKVQALEEKRKALLAKNVEWLDSATDAANKEAELAAAEHKANELIRQDYEKMPENQKQRFMSMFNYASADEMDWSKGSVLYSQLKNAFSNAYSEWGFSGYASSELFTAIDDAYKASLALVEAQKKTESLREEVEQGTKDYEEYSSNMDSVIEGLLSAGYAASDAEEEVEAVNNALKELDGSTATVTVLVDGAEAINRWKGHAKGLWTVPFDGYPALLHRGERVLTASQARDTNNSDSRGIIEAIQGLRNDINNLQLVVGRKSFGRAVVDYGGGRMSDYIGSSESRMASGYGT